MDVLVDDEDETCVVIEIKASNWDRMTDKAVLRNVRRQIRQIYSYIDTQIGIKEFICPGIVFPFRPESSERLNLIEELFLNEGISVVWDDETIAMCKIRNK